MKIQFEDKTKEHYDFISMYFKPYMSFDEFMAEKDYKILTLRMDDQLIGLTLIAIYNEKVSKVKIVYTIIKEEYRNKGLNKLLIDEVCKFTKEIGYSYVVANIRKSNISSLKSFLNYGFVKSVKKGTYDTGEEKIRVFYKI